MHGHFARGEGAGFIQSDGVHPGESFDGIEILDEDLFLAEADSGEGENGTGQENETLRNHIDKRSDRARDGRSGIVAFDTFLMIRKLMKNYGFLFGKKNKRKK